jgi:radical SAM superfamily enzyme YgiQ (UPF0313 family)
MSLDLLVVHPNAAKKIYQDLSKDFSAIEPPIWAGMIAQFVRGKGHTVDILDCEALHLTEDETIARIKEKSPKLVCCVVYGQQPSASTQNMVGALSLMKRIGSELGISRLYTGPHPSSLPKLTLEQDPGCYVCEGEGPVTVLELLETIKNSTNNFKSVRGLWYTASKILGDSTVEPTVEKNAPAPLFQDLDKDLPGVAWDLLPLENYRTANWHSWTNNNNKQPFASIYTSLGCPFKCTFCMINAPFNNGNINNNAFRHWSPEHIIKQFDMFAEKGIVNVKIADEMFVYKPAHFIRLCELIIERGYKFNIWAYARIDTIREKYLETLKKAGVNWLGLGIESANQNVRQEVTKGKFQELNIRDIVEKVREYGICAGSNYIFGLPGDTLQSMQETLDLALDLNTEYANFYCAMAYPGSQLHRDAVKNTPHLLPENNDIGWIGYSQHAYETYNLANENLTNKQILEFRDKAFLTYYTNPKYIEMMTAKFGVAFKEELDRMLEIKLKRQLLGE